MSFNVWPWFAVPHHARSGNIAEMVRVAVHTAKKLTSLGPHCTYHGGDNDSHWPRLKLLTGGAFISEVRRWSALLEEARAQE